MYSYYLMANAISCFSSSFC